MKIDNLTEQRIKDSADIVQVVGDFVELHASGRNYLGLCPFHDDRHLGSFVVSPNKNICRCFSCDKTWDSIAFLREHEGMTYEEALRWLGAKFGTFIDTATPVKVVQARPRQVVKKNLRLFPVQWVRDKMPDNGNVLLGWLRSLPWTDEDRIMLEKWIRWYGIGTMTTKDEQGWTIWWYINDKTELTEGKMMKFLPDGHRDKTEYINREGKKKRVYSINWYSTKLEDAGYFNSKTEYTEHCLFGLHMLNVVKDYPDVVICICESEKTAIICQTLSQPDKKLWMATGGKSGLNRKMLQPLIDANRKILVFPDHDGYEDWVKDAKAVGYARLQVSRLVEDNITPEDGEKADIADIMLRQMLAKHPKIELTDDLPPVTYPQLRNPLLDHPIVKHMIEKFELKEQQ